MNLLRIMLAVMVSVAWFASVMLTLFVPDRTVDPWVHMLTAAIATALFGPSIWKRNGNGNGGVKK